MAIGNSGNSTDVSFLRPPASGTPVRDQPNTSGTGTTSAVPSSGPEIATGGSAASVSTNEVSISAAAQELNRAPSTDPRANFDSARVSEIRAAIEAGDYPLDSARLADNILRLEQELGL